MTDEVSVTQADCHIAAGIAEKFMFADFNGNDISGLRNGIVGDSCIEDFVRSIAALRNPLAKPLLTLVGLTREYLPSDGISKDEFIQRILEALDNDEMAELVAELEGRK